MASTILRYNRRVSSRHRGNRLGRRARHHRAPLPSPGRTCALRYQLARNPVPQPARGPPGPPASARAARRKPGRLRHEETLTGAGGPRGFCGCSPAPPLRACRWRAHRQARAAGDASPLRNRPLQGLAGGSPRRGRRARRFGRKPPAATAGGARAYSGPRRAPTASTTRRPRATGGGNGATTTPQLLRSLSHEHAGPGSRDAANGRRGCPAPLATWCGSSGCGGAARGGRQRSGSSGGALPLHADGVVLPPGVAAAASPAARPFAVEPR